LATTIALAGDVVTASAGTLGVTIGGNLTVALSGAAVAAQAGTLLPSASVALAGSAVTSSAGTLVPATALGLTGAEVTTSAGTLGITVGGDRTIALSGELVTVSAGTLGVSGADVATGVTPAGGSRRRRRRYYVEIDGQQFLVDTPDEAAMLLQQAAALATKAAQVAADAIVTARTPRARRLGKVAPVRLVPRIKTDAPETAKLVAARSAIASIYDEAAMRAEMQLMLERQAALDDEQDIEDLIAIGAL